MNVPATRSMSTREVAFMDKGAGSGLAPQNLGEVVRFAEVMAQADIALPKHLRGNAGACMAVAMQALEWEMSPFAVAQKSYSVNGMIAYEAQLIAAVVNTRSGIDGRLRYTYSGEGNDLKCTVTGKLDGEEYEYTSPSMGSITTKNSPLWKSDPQQQLGYFSARSWARRYVPEVMLGVYDRDEAQGMKDVTPEPRPSMASKLAGTSQGEGFSQAHITHEIDNAGSKPAVEDSHDSATDQVDEAQPDTAPASSQGGADSDGAGDRSAPAPSPTTIEMAKRIVKYIGFLATDVPDGFDDKDAAIENLPKGIDPNTPEPEVRKLKAIKGFAMNVINAAAKDGDGYTFQDDCTPEWLEAEATNMLGIDASLLRDDAEKAVA